MMDSLMGQFRDVPLKEAKKRKGQNFKENNVCKAYLLGFCLQHEELFKNMKKASLQVGVCDKIHSDALKDEFEAHPEKAEYERSYIRETLRYLESLTRKVDEFVLQKAEEQKKTAEEKELSQVAKAQIDLVLAECKDLLAEAEELAEKGDIKGSKSKTWEYEEAKERAAKYEAKARETVKEDICEICGLRNEDNSEGVLKFTHKEGRAHLGFVKVREWIKKLKERLDKVEDESRNRKEEGRSKHDSDGAPAANSGDGDRHGDHERGWSRRDDRGGRDDRSRGSRDDRDRGSNRRRDDRSDGDGDRRRDDRGYDRGYDRRRDDRGDGDRGSDRRRDRGRDSERGYDNSYGRGRSRSGGRPR